MSMNQRAVQARQELIYRRAKADPCFWAEKFWYIRHPQGRRLLELRDPQRIALDNFASGQNFLTLKARQIGWSTITTTFDVPTTTDRNAPWVATMATG